MPKIPSILFLSHGGGPLPLLGDKGHEQMVVCLQEIAATIRKPSAILIISAHWEESTPTITAGANPPLIYDYYGFPEEAYRIQYPCPGEPSLAAAVHDALAKESIDAKLNDQRGFDHGVFVPLKIMYPAADIPCVQLSLVNDFNVERHIQLGRALQALRYENLLVIGSGLSFHNLNAFLINQSPELKSRNVAFEKWLIETCSNPEIDEPERTRRMVEWEKAPFARYCHPREEHLLPLHVCYGLAGKYCSNFFDVEILDTKSSMYFWSEQC